MMVYFSIPAPLRLLSDTNYLIDTIKHYNDNACFDTYFNTYIVAFN